MYTKICQSCEKVFFIKKRAEYLRENRVCCSRSCSTKLANQKRYEGIGVEKKCKHCGEMFFCKYSRERKIKQFCSVKCSLVLRNKTTNPHIIRERFSGENSPYWLGDKASYSAIHVWLRKAWGNANDCEECGGAKSKQFDWANISGKYSRERSDWKMLCRSCHKRYDFNKKSKGSDFAACQAPSWL